MGGSRHHERGPRAGRYRGRHARRVARRGPAAMVVLIAAMVALTAGCGCAGSGTSASKDARTTLAAVSTTTLPPTTLPPTTVPPTTVPPVTAPSTTIAATPGSPDSADPYFPSAGNGGYDVQSYDITLDIDPVRGRIAGQDTVSAVALQDLSAFYLDFQGLEVSAVKVDGAAAVYARSGAELRVSCPAPVITGAAFTVAVVYSGVPAMISAKQYDMGWQKVGDTTFTLDEPQGAATWFPVNDTPADKAIYTFRLTVPAPYTAAANGVLAGTVVKGAKRTFTWKMDEPMASYLAAVSVGRFATETATSAGGVVIRNYFATDLAAAAHDVFARTGEVVDYFTTLFGPYPFPVYGVVVPDANSGAAMENQTLSLFGRDVVTKGMSDPIPGSVFLSHELAHQWFGDSVTLERWDDIWLNEGFATYASWLWLEHDQGRQALDEQVRLSLVQVGKSREGPPGKPGADHLFGVSVYQRGALTLHALRLTVGDDSFFRILRTWTDRYKYGNADTAEFIALAKEEAPQVAPGVIDALFRAWLYGDRLPALPTKTQGA